MAENMSVTPYVQVAAFCQVALREAEGNLSLIRVADRQLVVGETKEMQPFNVQLTLVVILKSGNMQGSATLTVRPETPSGAQLPAFNSTVLFEGLERGVGIVSPVAFFVQETGLYWFDVLVDEVLLTRIPLRILYQQGPQISIGPPPSS